MRRLVDRRSFLQRALAAGGASLAIPFDELVARLNESGGRPVKSDGYGPLAPVKDDTTGAALLQLPEGFRYATFGWTGDPMEGGRRTPGLHDGMAAFAAGPDRVRLIRNHEIAAGPCFDESISYDVAAAGGTTTLEFDGGSGHWITARASLAGTVRNCAGGPTPWGTWLTCEETLLGPGENQPFTRPHGYIFEVPLDGKPSIEPRLAMGRFVHEAVAVDAETGIVYETEDSRHAGFYRFIPDSKGDLARGGRLEMLAVAGRPRYDTRKSVRQGERLPVAWVPIQDPNRAHETPALADGTGVFSQGHSRGGAVFARLEGVWAGAGNMVFTATSGGAAQMGQVWELDVERQVLRLVFESPGKDVLNMPDNVCLSPRGGLVLCEDGTENPSIHGMTREGRIFRFARNNVVLNGERNAVVGDFRSSEMAGATFSPDGLWLFFNVQTPGFTVALTGPWEKGLL